MLDRFKDAKWYIGEDGVSVTIYDASDLDGTGPDGHGMVCQGAVIEDARLIALAPTLLRIVKTLEGAWDSELKMPQCGIEAELEFEGAIDEAREAIAKAEGRE